MDNLLETVFTVVGLIIFIYSWFRRKSEAPDSDAWPELEPPTTAPPPLPTRTAPSPQPPPHRTLAWEEELRRLLEGETQTGMPSSPAPSTPQEAREDSPPPLIKPLPPSPSVYPSTPVSKVHDKVEAREAAGGHLAASNGSARAYHIASQLQDPMAEHMQTAAEFQRKTRPIVRMDRTVSPEVAGTVEWLRHRRTTRQAMIASIILGPPKALGNDFL